MSDVEIPNFGALLGDLIGTMSTEGVPGFLAGLEREAAARYRAWAEALPDGSEGLLACAAREDEIAERVSRCLPLPDSDLPAYEKALPEARRMYFAAFEGLTLREQLTIQANAERQGARAWRGMAEGVNDAGTRDELLACAALEEKSADHLDALLLGSALADG